MAGVACLLSIIAALSACGNGHSSLRVGLSGITHNYASSRHAWRELLDGARVAGVSFLHLQTPLWSETETSPGVFDLSAFDELVALNEDYGFAYTLDLATPLSVQGIDAPRDIEFTSFDDPALVTRYKAYVTAVLAKLDRPTHVILHTETAGSYFDGQATSGDFLAFCELIAITANHVRQTVPGAAVGVYGTRGETKAQLDCFNRSTDFFGMTYIADRGDDDHRARLDALAALAGDQPIALFEAGTPSAARVGGSESAQREFVRLLFEFASAEKGRLLFLSYYQFIDEDEALPRSYVPILFPWYDEEQREDAIAWFSSLGLYRNDGTPKPAWEEFRLRAQAAQSDGSSVDASEVDGIRPTSQRDEEAVAR